MELVEILIGYLDIGIIRNQMIQMSNKFKLNAIIYC